ncbi:MAG: ABC transporter ATP-binding protein [Chloroflexi bacterium]|nr:ABC transporter ATP-binding protein [Chloroflexota bacterium]MYK35074.1 ABC transporter ATP-binding protein [Chloroflexota bacterium]
MSGDGVQALTVSGVHKRFGNVEALRGVDLSVEQGEIFGFLGPNGAGKTTTIRVLTGFIRADQGAARVLGMEAWGETVAIKARLGFLPDVVAFASGFTGQDFLNYVASLRGIRGRLPRQAELLERLELPDSALRRKVKGYSSGMAKKLALVQAMQHDPDVLIMDEPTEALDPLMRQELFAIIREARDRGATVFMSSHVLSDVEEVCERVALIRDGRIVGTGSVEALREGKARTMEVEFRVPPTGGLSIPGVEVLSQEDTRWELAISGDINEVLRELAKHDIADMTYERLSLENLFMGFYGEGGGKELADA